MAEAEQQRQMAIEMVEERSEFEGIANNSFHGMQAARAFFPF